jgi:hypothetical protein
MMRLFNSSDHTNSVRLAIQESLYTRYDRGSGRAVAASGIGRDDQDFWLGSQNAVLLNEVVML